MYGIQFKKLGHATLWGGGGSLVSGGRYFQGRVATFGGPLLSGFTSGHKKLTLISGGRYYRNFTVL